MHKLALEVLDQLRATYAVQVTGREEARHVVLASPAAGSTSLSLTLRMIDGIETVRLEAGERFHRSYPHVGRGSSGEGTDTVEQAVEQLREHCNAIVSGGLSEYVNSLQLTTRVGWRLVWPDGEQSSETEPLRGREADDAGPTRSRTYSAWTLRT